MKILVKRIAKKEKYTIGHLFINDEYFCDTIEDKDRGLDDSMTESEIKKIKIKGKTAIPTGEYKLTIDYSPHFGKNCFHILNVKGFDGIRIHSGNDEEDSEGCLIVGQNKLVGKVINSKDTLAKLYKKTDNEKNIKIIIK
jgi:hypothetical protein